MKRLLGVFLLLSLICGAAFAEDLGLSAGVELNGGDVADDFVFGLSPLVQYDNAFGDLELYGEAKYNLVFGDDTVQNIYLEEEITYSLSVGPGILSFIVNNQNVFNIAPSGGDAVVDSIVEPSVKYAQEFSFGELFAKAGAPIAYAPDTAVDVFLTLAYYNFGFGAELTGTYAIDPDAGLAGFGLLLNYEADNFYAEVDLGTNKDFDSFVISPYFEYYLGSITIWAGVDFENIGGDGDVAILPYLGATYSF